jgi:2-iminobutanoate/2-iminopropanoate deaminase
MPRKVFTSEGAVAVGPYSHAVEANGFVYLSGQTPLDPNTGKLAIGGISEQTKQVFINLFNVLGSAGLTSDDVIKVNVFLTDMADFVAMNEIYAQQFNSPYPARSTIGVNELPRGSLVEIEMIAQRKNQGLPNLPKKDHS